MLIINKDQFKIGDLNINTNQILKSVNDTNKYLFDLSMQFKNLNIDLIESLGNRNLSGTIGEIFKYFLVSEFKMFKMKNVRSVPKCVMYHIVYKILRILPK